MLVRGRRRVSSGTGTDRVVRGRQCPSGEEAPDSCRELMLSFVTKLPWKVGSLAVSGWGTQVYTHTITSELAFWLSGLSLPHDNASLAKASMVNLWMGDSNMLHFQCCKLRDIYRSSMHSAWLVIILINAHRRPLSCSVNLSVRRLSSRRIHKQLKFPGNLSADHYYLECRTRC